LNTTRPSLLLRVRNREDDRAWGEFVALYRPLLLRYAQARGLDPEDAEDVAQHCLANIIRKIRDFEYDPRLGRFRSWLRRMVDHRVISVFRRRRELHADTREFERPQQRERSPDETWQRIWLEEHLRHCLEQVRTRVAPHTFEAFHRVVLKGCPVPEVCGALDMTPNQVYVARSRVTRHLQDLMAELVGEDG